MADTRTFEPVVICSNCKEALRPVGNGTYRHGPRHYRSKGHRHRPLAVYATDPPAEPGQGVFAFLAGASHGQ